MSSPRFARFGAPRSQGRYRSARVAWLAALVAALASGGCGLGGGGSAGDPFGGAAGSTRVGLDVENRNFYDATLYAISDTGRRRIGVVGGNQSARFNMPWDFTADLRIEIDLLAGGSCTTRPIVVNSGDVLELVIETNIRNSAYCY